MIAAYQQTQQQNNIVLDLVVFKWLMAGFGWWIDVSRLRRDTVYASECMRRGLDSGCPLLRRKCAELPCLLARSAE